MEGLSAAMDLVAAVNDFESDTSSVFHQSRLNEVLENLFLEQGEWQHRLTISSLSKVLNIADTHSPVTWNVIRLLESVSPEKVQLSKLQNLVPSIARMTEAATTEDRKLSILKVLQALTYGLKITRPSLFIGPLISATVKWAKERNQKSVVQLSLSVLVNLLHRNPIVLASLIQTVNLKQFMNSLLHIRSDVLCRMEVCELMFLLEDLIYEKPHEAEVVNFIKVSMCTLIDFKSQSKSHLQHCVFFFGDMVNQKKISTSQLDQPWFFKSINEIISALEKEIDTIDVTILMLLVKFLGIFVGMRVLAPVNVKLMQLGVTCVKKHQRDATEAITLMQAILTQSENKCDGLSVKDISEVILPLLTEATMDEPDVIFLSNLLTFCSLALEFREYRTLFTENFSTKMIDSILNALPPKLHKTNYSSAEPLVKMSINIFYFVFKIMSYDSSWIKFYTCLFNDERCVSILAVALMHGSSEVKNKVFCLICSVGFPGESFDLLAKLMAECGKRKIIEEDTNEVLISPRNAMFLADNQNLMSNIKELMKQNKDIPVSKVLQLYNYKEQLHMDCQKSLLGKLTESTTHITLLQEEIEATNQITSELLLELDTLKSSYEDLKEKHQIAVKTLDDRAIEFEDLKQRHSQESSSCQSTVLILTKTIEGQKQEINSLSKNAKDLKEELKNAVDKCSKMEEALVEKDIAQKLTDDKLDDLMKELEKKVPEMDLLEKEVERLKGDLKTKQDEILELGKDRNAKAKEIIELQRVRDMVFEIAGGRKKM